MRRGLCKAAVVSVSQGGAADGEGLWSVAAAGAVHNVSGCLLTLAGRKQQQRAQHKCLIGRDGAQLSQHVQVSCWCTELSLPRTCWGMMQHAAPATFGLQLSRVTHRAGRPLRAVALPASGPSSIDTQAGHHVFKCCGVATCQSHVRRRSEQAGIPELLCCRQPKGAASSSIEL